MQVELGFNYKTVWDGFRVEVFTVTAPHPTHPVVGFIHQEGIEPYISQWTLDGKDIDNEEFNLMKCPIWEPSEELVAVLRPGWIVYTGDAWWWHDTEPGLLDSGRWDFFGKTHSLAAVDKGVLPPINSVTRRNAFKIGNPKQ